MDAFEMMLSSLMIPSKDKMIIQKVENGYLLMLSEKDNTEGTQDHLTDEEIEQDIWDGIDTAAFSQKLRQTPEGISGEEIKKEVSRIKRNRREIFPSWRTSNNSPESNLKTYSFKTFEEVLDFLKENYGSRKAPPA